MVYLNSQILIHITSVLNNFTYSFYLSLQSNFSMRHCLSENFKLNIDRDLSWWEGNINITTCYVGLFVKPVAKPGLTSGWMFVYTIQPVV